MGIQQLIWAIERVGDSFHAAIHRSPDLDAALAATAADCELLNLPMRTGARGTEGLRRYLAEDVLPHLPADLSFRRMSRTVDRRRVADEVTVGFTHDRELPWLLPGAAPTHRHAEVSAMSVVTFRHTTRLGAVSSLISSHRTLWDHSGLLAQLGLDPSQLPAGLPDQTVMGGV
jgi:carboxymethylenebutenolidase